MKLVIDTDLCEGCESCVQICPDHIKMGNDGKAHVVSDNCDGCDCEEAAGICPVEAIKVEK